LVWDQATHHEKERQRKRERGKRFLPPLFLFLHDLVAISRFAHHKTFAVRRDLFSRSTRRDEDLTGDLLSVLVCSFLLSFFLDLQRRERERERGKGVADGLELSEFARFREEAHDLLWGVLWV